MRDSFSSKYKIHHRDRLTGSGGGVLVAIRNGINNVREVDLETDCEVVWVRVTARGTKALYV